MPSSQTWLAVAAALVSLSLPAARCAAQSVDAEEAAALFDRGVELYREGDLDAALTQMERVYELAPKPGILYNLAQIQVERHQYVAASSLYEKFLNTSEDASDPRKADARAQVDKLRGRIADLWVECNVDGARLSINDEPAGTLPLSEPLKIDAGVSRVRVVMRGYQPAVQTLKVVGGDRARLVLSLQPVEAGAKQPVGTATPSRRPRYWPFGIAAATTVALGAVTLTTGLTMARADRDLDRALDRLPAREEEVSYYRSRLRTFAGLTDGFGAASIVALGVSLYLLVRPPEATPRDARRLGVAPTAGGLSLHGTF